MSPATPQRTDCPQVGTWRAWLDGEAAVVGPDEHLAVCASCAATLARLRTDAAATALAMDRLVPSSKTNGPPPPPVGDVVEEVLVVAPRRGMRAMAAAAVVTLVVAVLLTPAGRGYASAVLSMFRSEQVTLIEIGNDDAEAAAAVMQRLGEVDGPATAPEPRRMDSVTEAESVAGFPVATPEPGALPAGVAPDPQVLVASGHDAVFRFDADRTVEYLSSMGTDTDLPPGYDGARLVVHVPTAVMVEYGGEAAGMPGLVVGTAAPITAEVTGDITLESLRGFLLELPGFPEGVARQLRAIDDWTATLPVPVPVDVVRAQETQVAGHDALVVHQPGMGAALVWHEGDRIVAVAGPYDEAEVRRVAEGLAGQ